MRVFIITDNLMKGGKERRLMELLRYFDKENNIKTKLVILRDRIDYPEVYGLQHTELVILKRKIKKDPFVFFQILKIIKEFKPQIIHSWGSMPSIYSFLIAHFKKIAFVNAMITNSKCKKYGSEWLRAKITFPFSNIVLSNSYAGLRAYKAPLDRGKVIHNGFNFSRLENLKDANEIRSKYSIKTSIVIGMVAAFHPRKDYSNFLEVANEICKINEDVTFLAIGDGESKKDFEQKYKENDRIVFTGNVNNVESVINVLDIGVLLTNSNNHLEGISNSLIEYMALGKSVIATKGGGTDELIINNENGLLIEPMSKIAFSSALKKLIGSHELRVSISKKAHLQIKENFSIESMGNKTIELYQELLH
ncbi:glycosyltransferase [Plebeiibacterium sediminum]|uniref:Glycosyltransferase n=1 Tax=Plebeiibacterium sediminum TaxID=2992112 RepID=A0AAE3SEQ0_9BACT|nr:glycosyltransferase [Plebeiobacterium sediminum]MCW3786242.1 glycosyltransferase [Plebeiobacterium sediminum]